MKRSSLDSNSDSTPGPNRPPLSPAQLAANQANAQHSTGPRSSSGKARASANALKHGLRGVLNAQNLYLLRNESPAELDQLRAALTAEFRPHTPSQHLLLQQLIAFQIRYQRAQRYYNHLLFDKADAMRPQVEATYQAPFIQDVANALAYESLANNGQALRLLTRDLDRLPTKIQRLIQELNAIQPSEADDDFAAETEAQTEQETQNSTNEPISSLDLLPDEVTSEPAPILACSVINCIQPFHPCPNCRPIGEVPRVNDHPDWPPDCLETDPEPILSYLKYHINNPEVVNFVHPTDPNIAQEIWAAVEEEMKNDPDNDDNIQPGEE